MRRLEKVELEIKALKKQMEEAKWISGLTVEDVENIQYKELYTKLIVSRQEVVSLIKELRRMDDLINQKTKLQAEKTLLCDQLSATQLALVRTRKQLEDAELSGMSNSLAHCQCELVKKTNQNEWNKEHITRLGNQLRELHLEMNYWKNQA